MLSIVSSSSGDQVVLSNGYARAVLDITRPKISSLGGGKYAELLASDGYRLEREDSDGKGVNVVGECCG